MTTAATELHFLRHVPGNSPVHRMWAGTKLLVVAGIGIAIVAQPSWPAQAPPSKQAIGICKERDTDRTLDQLRAIGLSPEDISVIMSDHRLEEEGR